MSDITTSIRKYLTGRTAVTDLVPADRIRPDVLKQNETMPAITVRQFDSSHEHGLAGAAGLYESRVRVECYADTRLESNAIAEAVRNQLQGFTGTMEADYVNDCLLDATASDVDTPRDGSDRWRFRTRLTWRLFVQESIPTL